VYYISLHAATTERILSEQRIFPDDGHSGISESFCREPRLYCQTGVLQPTPGHAALSTLSLVKLDIVTNSGWPKVRFGGQT
jgi:hypothetical protein